MYTEKPYRNQCQIHYEITIYTLATHAYIYSVNRVCTVTGMCIVIPTAWEK